MLKRGGRITTFGDALESTLRDNELKEPLRPRISLAIWADVVGPDIAAVTNAETVRSGVLFVRVKSNVWANELTFYKADIITRLNKRLGAGSISDIHFRTTGPKSKPVPIEPEPTVGPTDDELRRIRPDGPLAELARSRSSISDPDADRQLRTIASRIARTNAWKREHGWIECQKCKALFEPPKQPARQDICHLCSTMSRVSA